MAGNLLGGWLSDRFGRGWVFAVGSTVAIGGIACLGVLRSPDDWLLLLIYTASGLGFGMRIAQLAAIPADNRVQGHASSAAIRCDRQFRRTPSPDLRCLPQEPG